jgi:hypothetical protein
MTVGLRVVLMLFAVVGFAGAGAALAVARQRLVTEEEHDLGMLAVSGMLFVFGALCTTVATGPLGIAAFGGVAVWTSYVATAQRVGLFAIQAGRLEEPAIEEHHRRS